MSKIVDERQIIDGQYVAQMFKFFFNQKNTNIYYKLPFNKIQARSLYVKYKKTFDSFAIIFSKYKLDLYKYVKFLVIDCNKCEKDVSLDLINSKMLVLYANKLKIIEKQNRIYKYFMKSVNNILEDCKLLKFNNSIDYLRLLISKKMLSSYVISGKISKYFLAGIPNFKKVIDKLDQLSKDEFQELYDRFDIYNSEINQVFLKLKNIKVNPIAFVNERLQHFV